MAPEHRAFRDLLLDAPRFLVSPKRVATGSSGNRNVWAVLSVVQGCYQTPGNSPGIHDKGIKNDITCAHGGQILLINCRGLQPRGLEHLKQPSNPSLYAHVRRIISVVSGVLSPHERGGCNKSSSSLEPTSLLPKNETRQYCFVGTGSSIEYATWSTRRLNGLYVFVQVLYPAERHSHSPLEVRVQNILGLSYPALIRSHRAPRHRYSRSPRPASPFLRKCRNAKMRPYHFLVAPTIRGHRCLPVIARRGGPEGYVAATHRLHSVCGNSVWAFPSRSAAIATFHPP